jgi:hypothetical protein
MTLLGETMMQSLKMASLFDAIIEGISQDLNDVKRAGIWMKRVEKKVRRLRNDGAWDPEKNPLVAS